MNELKLELGYEIIPLALPESQPNLQAEIPEMRSRLAVERGVDLPAVHILDAPDLPPRGYRISCGQVVEEDELATEDGVGSLCERLEAVAGASA